MAGITLASGRRYDGPLYPIETKRSPVTSGAPPRAAPEPRRAEHFHVYLHGAPAVKPVARTHDAVPTRRPAFRRGDQAPEGELICVVSQHGETGRWQAADPDGHELQVTQNGPGPLEIRRMPANAENEGPDQIILERPPGAPRAIMIFGVSVSVRSPPSAGRETVSTMFKRSASCSAGSTHIMRDRDERRWLETRDRAWQAPGSARFAGRTAHCRPLHGARAL
jgi:hypothetical protein